MADNTVERIQALKKEKNAVILVHNYQRGEVQDIGDFVGDSLELSQKAVAVDAEVIVFCGVHFMAETASILNPQKTILLPDAASGCPMADMINSEQLRKKKQELPGYTVVTYVNSTAAVKAESDYCCTSANGVKVVNAVKNDKILFVPDQYLGDYIMKKTGKKMELWPGYCPTHANIKAEDIKQKRMEHPKAKVVVHPECTPEVIKLADEALSTSGIIRYAARPDVQELIVGTEVEILHRLKKENPGKQFYPASLKAVCPNMKRITLEKVLQSLEMMMPVVRVPEEIRIRAKAAVDRMLEIV
ncbi:MAG: quinolinate synthase NadA [Dehalococcoidales bacterium]|nr:quinolinate synthase NadA [Dehalococcoidales bacterium]